MLLVLGVSWRQSHGYSDAINRPSFVASSFSGNRICSDVIFTNDNDLCMKVSRGKSKTSGVKGSEISLRNYERQKSAGRRGSRNFKDPNKTFVGNLDYNVTSEMLKQWLLEEHGVPAQHVISVKVIQDWKTKVSKGYGFIQFTSPIYATSAIELIRNKRLLNRVVRLDQGQKKKPEAVVVVKATDESRDMDEEEIVIFEATNDALDEISELEISEPIKNDNLEEEAGLVSFEDLLDAEDGDYVFDDGLDSEQEDKEVDLDGLAPLEYEFYQEGEEDQYDDSDEGVDGIYEQVYGEEVDDESLSQTMNRAQRRDAAKSKKKRRKPGKGFGNTPIVFKEKI